MYQNKLAVAIKHNGKILRENKDLVHLPFGSEFSVLVKNLNSRRAKFTLHIDGTNVLDGTEIIVNANSEVEMKRFIRNGNMNEGNAFKFIERTQQIEDGPRGIKVDDGVVRVEFWFEKEAPEVKTIVHKHYDEWYYGNPYRRHFWNGPYDVTYGSGPVFGSSTDISNIKLGSNSAGLMRGMASSASASLTSTDGTATAYNASFDTSQTMDGFEAKVADAGITVPGSKVEQKFHTVYGFVAESVSNVIVIRLAGKVGSKEVVKPITVSTKQKCETCGKVNKATSKYCSGCGSALELL